MFELSEIVAKTTYMRCLAKNTAILILTATAIYGDHDQGSTTPDGKPNSPYTIIGIGLSVNPMRNPVRKKKEK